MAKTNYQRLDCPLGGTEHGGGGGDFLSIKDVPTAKGVTQTKP